MTLNLDFVWKLEFESFTPLAVSGHLAIGSWPSAGANLRRASGADPLLEPGKER